jgi:hypothetical protein
MVNTGYFWIQQKVLKEGPEGVKWELGFAYFWVGKWDFMHWDWDSSAQKQ